MASRYIRTATTTTTTTTTKQLPLSPPQSLLLLRPRHLTLTRSAATSSSSSLRTITTTTTTTTQRYRQGGIILNNWSSSSSSRRHLSTSPPYRSSSSSSNSSTSATTTTSSSSSSSSSPPADFTHAVIGAGAVGLAIARRLQQHHHHRGGDAVSTVLIEKHGAVGTETSSRNSEVIHAGLYYGPDSLKTKLCLKGKEMMYHLCKQHDIPHMNCGKWIVAQDQTQLDALHQVHDHANAIGVPVSWLSKEQARRREPDVRCEAGVLESPSTGIVDSHSYMQFLHASFEDAGGDTALASPVTRIEPPSAGSPHWKIWTSADVDDDDSYITAETVINSAGLYACDINNMIMPPERQRTQYYAKGTYFSHAKSHPKPSVLVYPAPVPGKGGLGTHLTLDMGGRVRFGPDVEWVDSPTDLAPTNNEERFKAALADIKAYLPAIDGADLALDYAGIRPKLSQAGSVTSGKGFHDFYISKEEGFDGFINLLGIESPGLTASLAIAEEVYEMLYR